MLPTAASHKPAERISRQPPTWTGRQFKRTEPLFCPFRNHLRGSKSRERRCHQFQLNEMNRLPRCDKVLQEHAQGTSSTFDIFPKTTTPHSTHAKPARGPGPTPGSVALAAPFPIQRGVLVSVIDLKHGGSRRVSALDVAMRLHQNGFEMFCFIKLALEKASGEILAH